MYIHTKIQAPFSNTIRNPLSSPFINKGARRFSFRYSRICLNCVRTYITVINNQTSISPHVRLIFNKSFSFHIWLIHLFILLQCYQNRNCRLPCSSNCQWLRMRNIGRKIDMAASRSSAGSNQLQHATVNWQIKRCLAIFQFPVKANKVTAHIGRWDIFQ